MESFKHILQFQTVHSVQILYSVHSVYILYILNNAWFDMNMQGSSKPTAPSRGRPRSAPARTGAPLHRAHRWNAPKYKSICHGKDVLTRAMKLLNLTQNFFFKLWIPEVTTRSRIWLLGHSLRQVGPNYDSVTTGGEGWVGGSKARGADIDLDQCLGSTQPAAPAVWY